MKTRCNTCRKKIPMGNSLCPECRSKKIKDDKNYLKDKDAEKHSKTAKWQSVRKKAIVRDKGVCQLCLARGHIENRKLAVHHMVKRTTVVGTVEEYLIYDLDNLITVCPACHEELEKLSVTKQKELLKWKRSEEIEFYL